ncbi:MAG: Thiol-disulfide oxidoreductase ResA [Verrucomicrobiota bacterium]|jgi:thiol-disulfide isomerase/thioredoxin
MKVFFAALSLAVAGLSAVAQDAAPAAAAAEGLKVGSPAPEVKFGKFFKGSEVKALAADQNYIIECWATWCGPCVAAFPHLSEIAKATAGKVNVIGVAVWERQNETQLQSFVDKQGSRMAYSVTVDADNTIADKWLKAAGQNGIPCAFLVIKGKIAWIGHPGSLEAETVLGLAEGKLTIEDVARLEKEAEALQQEVAEKVFSKARAGDMKGALAASEEMIKANPKAAKMLKGPMEHFSFAVLVSDKPAEATQKVLAITETSEFLQKGNMLAGMGKLSADDCSKLDASAGDRFAKLGADDNRDKVFCTLFRANLLGNQGKFAEAADMIEKAKPSLDPQAGQFLDRQIAGFKAKIAAPAKN